MAHLNYDLLEWQILTDKHVDVLVILQHFGFNSVVFLVCFAEILMVMNPSAVVTLTMTGPDNVSITCHAIRPITSCSSLANTVVFCKYHSSLGGTRTLHLFFRREMFYPIILQGY